MTTEVRPCRRVSGVRPWCTFVLVGLLAVGSLGAPALVAQDEPATDSPATSAAAQAVAQTGASETDAEPKPPAEPIEPRGHSEAFLDAIRGEDEAVRAAAAEVLMAGSLIAQRDGDATTKIAEQVVALESLFGIPIGYERLKEERFGESLMRLVYVSKYQQAPITWEFFYYRPEGQWSLINVNIQRGFGLLRSNP